MKKISSHSRVYIIAEIGMNHNGDYQTAVHHIEAAADAGVDAVKFQMHISRAEMLPDAPTPPYFTQESRWDYFNRTAFPISQWKRLVKKAHENHLDFIISPFSEEAVRWCRQLSVDYLKIASGEVNNIFLLNAVVRSKLPVILSSGMSSLEELDKSVEILSRKGTLQAILQCTSEYPCTPQRVGLNVMADFIKRYPNISIGFSDHTLHNYASFAAVALGARVVEKHFTLSKKAYGPDAKFSLEPLEMSDLVRGVRVIKKIMHSKVDKSNLLEYREMRNVFCKSIVARKKIKKGEKILYSKLTAKKPGYGLLPFELSTVLHKVAKRTIKENEMIGKRDVE
jgi:N-acetylneuraminate synthase/N,N'-diacetyllegionaminate synthase